MAYVGIDLTDAFAACGRPVDVCVLDEDLRATFRRLVEDGHLREGRILQPSLAMGAGGST